MSKRKIKFNTRMVLMKANIKFFYLVQKINNYIKS